MKSPSLREFVNHALETRRIRFGDLRRLQRDILPARIATREEAAMLIDLDRAVRTADRDWSDYLVAAMRDFVVWGLPPIGAVDRDKAEWLVSTLSSGKVTKTGRLIAREVAKEARQVDDDGLLALSSESRRNLPQWQAAQPGREAVETGRPESDPSAPLACPKFLEKIPEVVPS